MKTITTKARPTIKSGFDLKQWRRGIGITRPVYANLSNCSERTLATKEGEKKLSMKSERRLNETMRLLIALGEIMEKENISTWLNEKNEWFDGQTPMNIISQGNINSIWEMIFHTREGGYA